MERVCHSVTGGNGGKEWCTMIILSLKSLHHLTNKIRNSPIYFLSQNCPALEEEKKQ